MRITLSNGAIASKNFRVASDGTAEFKGTLKIGSTSLSATNTLNANTVGSDLGTGYGDSSIGGLTLAASKIYIGTGTQNNANTTLIYHVCICCSHSVVLVSYSGLKL